MKWIQVLGLLCLGLFLESCSSITVLRTEEIRKEVGGVQKQVDSLHAVIDSLNQVQIAQNRRIQADLRMVLSALTEGNEKLAARLEENQYLLDRMSTKSSAAGVKVKLSPALQQQGAPVAPLVETIVESTSSSATASSSSSVEPSSDGFDLEMEKAYSEARLHYNEQRYKEAFLGFKGVYEKNPIGPLAENALFWMASSYDQTNQGEKALKVFERSLSEFPDGKKLCSVLFQMGRIHGELKNHEDQRQTWQRLLDNATCAGSSEAFRASENIGKIPQ